MKTLLATLIIVLCAVLAACFFAYDIARAAWDTIVLGKSVDEQTGESWGDL